MGKDPGGVVAVEQYRATVARLSGAQFEDLPLTEAQWGEALVQHLDREATTAVLNNFFGK